MEEKSNADEVLAASHGSVHLPEDGANVEHERSVKSPAQAHEGH